MNNLLSYCGLVDAKIRASDKDLPVQPPPLREVRKGLGKRTSSSSGFSSAR